MKVQLLRAARVQHSAGEIVEVSPATAYFLISTGSAVSVAEAITPPKTTTKKTTKTTKK